MRVNSCGSSLKKLSGYSQGIWWLIIFVLLAKLISLKRSYGSFKYLQFVFFYLCNSLIKIFIKIMASSFSIQVYYGTTLIIIIGFLKKASGGPYAE